MPFPKLPALAALGLILAATAATAASPAELLERRDWAGALEAAQAASRQDPHDIAARVLAGRALLELHRTADSVDTLRDATQRDPGSADAWLWLAEALAIRVNEVNPFSRLGIANEMRQAFERAVELAPANDAYRWELFQYYRQAPSIAGGSEDKARKQIAVFEKSSPGRAHQARGELLAQDRQKEAAEKEFRAAIAADPANPDHRFALALHLEAAKRWDDAWTVLRDLHAKIPKFHPATYRLGKIAIETQQRLREGEAALREYLKTPPHYDDPTWAWAHYRLGQVLALQGKPEAARAEYEAALDLDAGLAEARRARAALGDSPG